MFDYQVIFFIGAALIVSGYLIWMKKKYFLIAGFRNGRWYGKKVDPENLARLVGLYQICTGVALFAGSLLFHWLGASLGFAFTLFALAFTYANLRRIKN